MNVELTKQYTFEAAHTTPWRGSQRLHGHSYIVEIVVAGMVDRQLGWLVDYGVISARFNPLYKQLDHFHLDCVDGLEDVSVAGVRQWILDRLHHQLPQLKDVHVRVVGPCTYAPAEVAANRVRFAFEAAHFLPRLPDDHKCKRMHGHSFSVEVGLPKMDGVTTLLEDVYMALDHRCLNDIPGLENPTSEHVCRWIWEFIVGRRTDVSVVSVAETCTARCDYYGS